MRVVTIHSSKKTISRCEKPANAMLNMMDAASSTTSMATITIQGISILELSYDRQRQRGSVLSIV